MKYSGIILFDGVCNLCNSSVNFVIDHDPDSKFKFAALQSNEGMGLLSRYNLQTQDYASIILIEGGKYFQKSTAALRIAGQLSGGWPVLFYMFYWMPVFIRDFFYEVVSKNRYKFFGKTEACRVPTPELKTRFL